MFKCRFCGKEFNTSSGRGKHEGQKHDITQKLTRDFLEKKYIEEKMTVREISSITGFGEWQVSEAFKRLRIPLRTHGESLKLRGTLAGEKHPFYGTKGSFYGKSHSDEAKRKKSEKMKEYLRRHPEVLERLRRNLEKGRQDVTGKNNPNWRGGHYKECKLCGEKFWAQPSKENTRFCSVDCANEWIQLSGIMSLEKNPNWHGGVSFEPYTTEFNGKLKKKVRNRDGNRCRLCGSLKRLSIHHINYNKTDCRYENLITLCAKCNSKVNFNRKHWEKVLKKLLSDEHHQIDSRNAEIERNPPQIIFQSLDLFIQPQQGYNR
jgi:hypothetical protein